MKELLKSKRAFSLFLGFIVLLQYLILNGITLSMIVDWPAHEMTVNYSFGFIRRGFLGTIVKFISQVFQADTLSIIFITQFVGTIVFTGLLFLFFFLILKKTESSSVKMMILLFIALGTIGFYFDRWGELDMFLISLSLLACFLIIRDKFLWLVPLLVAVCVMIHEGYVLMYFGIIMALLLYRAAVATGKNKKKYWICLFATGLIASILFVYFYFFSVSVSSVHINEILANEESILGVPSLVDHMNYIYTGISKIPTEFFYLNIFVVTMNLLVCLPVILIMIDFWRMVIQQNTDKRKKILIALCISLQFLTIPMVLIQTDQARWFYDFVFFNFIFITSVICIGDKEFSHAAEKCFSPSVGKAILFVFYFIFFLNPHIQTISCYYLDPAFYLTALLKNFRPDFFL